MTCQIKQKVLNIFCCFRSHESFILDLHIDSTCTHMKSSTLILRFSMYAVNQKLLMNYKKICYTQLSFMIPNTHSIKKKLNRLFQYLYNTNCLTVLAS